MQSFRATVTMSAVKQVTCEHCSTVFHYAHSAVKRAESISLFGFDAGVANKRANRSALQAAKSAVHGVVPIACPKCCRLQTNMIPALRRQYCRRRQWIGLTTPAALAIILLGVALLQTDFFADPLPPGSVPYFLAFGIGAIVAFLLFGARPWLTSRNFDQNYFGTVRVPVGTAGPAPQSSDPLPPIVRTENLG